MDQNSCDDAQINADESHHACSTDSAIMNDAPEVLDYSLSSSSLAAGLQEQGDMNTNNSAALPEFRDIDRRYHNEVDVFIKREADVDDWSYGAGLARVGRDSPGPQPQAMGAIFPVKVEVSSEDPNQAKQHVDLLSLFMLSAKGESSTGARPELKKGQVTKKTTTKRRATANKRSSSRKQATPRRFARANKNLDETAKMKHQPLAGKGRPSDVKLKQNKNSRQSSNKKGKNKHGMQKTSRRSKEKICSFCSRKFVRQDFFDRHLAMHTSLEEKKAGKRKVTDETSEDEGKKKKKSRSTGNAVKANPRKLRARKLKSTVKEFLCPVCNKTFRQKGAYVVHQRVHRADRVTCKFCDKTFSSSAILSSHKWSAHKEEIGHKCTVCDKMYQKKIDLTYHFRAHTGERPHVCDQCGKSYARSKDLVEHIRVHSGEMPHKCPVCGALFRTSSSFAAHKKRHRSTPFLCPKCPKRFSEEPMLELHIDWHEKQDIHSCSMCEKSFSSTKSLTAHVRLKHSEVPPRKPFFCALCNKKFTRKASLTGHMHDHLGTKPWKCDLCGKGFTIRGHLATHMRAHGSGAYKCEQCGKRFPWESDLLLHRNMEHEKPPRVKREHTCDWCYKVFDCASSLKRHTLIHTGEKAFLCDVCGKACKTRSELGQHVKCHSVVKPYVCTYCEKAFSYKGNLMVHMRIHTGEKPYACCACGKMFNQKSNLVTHELKKHGFAGAPNRSSDTFSDGPDVASHSSAEMIDAPVLRLTLS